MSVAPVQPNRVTIDETTTDNRYPQTLGQFDDDLADAVLAGDITLRSARATQHEREARRMYIEVTGCNNSVSGEHGTTVAFTRNRLDATGPVARYLVDGAFVRLDQRPAMIYVELGEHVGSRSQYAEVVSWREIDRDEFDRLAGLTEYRQSMGWTL